MNSLRQSFAHPVLNSCSNRRHFLGSSAMSIGSLGLATLLQRDDLLAATIPEKPSLEKVVFDTLPKPPHFEPRAKAMISLFMGGGPSHIDMFDPKPALAKLDGKIFPGDVKYDNAGGASKVCMSSPFKFAKRGQSGMEISELLPHIAGIADDITLVRSMNLGGIRNHDSGIRAMNSGRGVGGRPALGSWLTYALGSERQDLPAYVALVVGGDPPSSPHWSNGFLPSIYQGTYVREQEPRILNLDPPTHLKGEPQSLQLSLMRKLNLQHLAEHRGESDLEARIASYELAARMQLAASEAMDLKRESEATRRLYGVDQKETKSIGEACLIARRLVERGVRFVQIWYYAWDMHAAINDNLPNRCRNVDQPSAALVNDLKSRGMLDTTLVFWGGEMGRLPVVQMSQGNSKPGRDHNTDGFSIWLAGGGVKRGHTHGATDDFGLFAVQDVVHHYDYLATVMHLLGLDAEKLTFKRNSNSETILDGQSGKVVKGILA